LSVTDEDRLLLADAGVIDVRVPTIKINWTVAGINSGDLSLSGYAG
jgi:hypothetical protein